MVRMSIYFLPVFSIKKAEYLECCNCATTYKRELARIAGETFGEKIQERLKYMIRYGSDLREIYRQVSTAQGSEEQTLKKIAILLGGNSYRICQGCSGVFLSSFDTCPKCGAKISTSRIFEPTPDILRAHFVQELQGDCLRPLE